MAQNGSFYFFWGGPLSQWHACKFKLAGKTYNCAEQYMMAEKARLFGDDDAERKIMAAKNPRMQKSLGRKVRGYSDNQWNSVCRDAVYRGNLAKFSQDEKLGKLLKTLAGLTIVEASPRDAKWGIAMHEDDPNVTDPTQWKGSNWLGLALMKVRDELLAKAETKTDSH
jgi:ribA/ribD-fused uncharacterized protein